MQVARVVGTAVVDDVGASVVVTGRVVFGSFIRISIFILQFDEIRK